MGLGGDGLEMGWVWDGVGQDGVKVGWDGMRMRMEMACDVMGRCVPNNIHSGNDPAIALFAVPPRHPAGWTPQWGRGSVPCSVHQRQRQWRRRYQPPTQAG